jgi:hypothetical protein
VGGVHFGEGLQVTDTPPDEFERDDDIARSAVEADEVAVDDFDVDAEAPGDGDLGDGVSEGSLDDAQDGAAPTATTVLEHIVRSIVDDADAVRVEEIEGRNRVKLEVRVGDGDLGRVIGRRGRTAQSIRTVVRAAATRDGVDVDVDFAD